MRKKYEPYLKDISNSIISIENFVKGVNYEQFKKDDKTSSAVIRKLEIIGEATKYIPDDIRRMYSQIPWKEMAGMRDKLVHEYFGIDYELVWDVIKNEIDELELQIKTIIDQENDNWLTASYKQPDVE